MTEKDLSLIEKAKEYTDGSDWNMLSVLEEQAESDKCKRELHVLKMTLFRKEQKFAGL